MTPGLWRQGVLLPLLVLADVLYRQFGQLLAANLKFLACANQVVHPVIGCEGQKLGVRQKAKRLPLLLFSHGGALYGSAEKGGITLRTTNRYFLRLFTGLTFGCGLGCGCGGVWSIRRSTSSVLGFFSSLMRGVCAHA